MEPSTVGTVAMVVWSVVIGVLWLMRGAALNQKGQELSELLRSHGIDAKVYKEALETEQFVVTGLKAEVRRYEKRFQLSGEVTIPQAAKMVGRSPSSLYAQIREESPQVRDVLAHKTRMVVHEDLVQDIFGTKLGCDR